MNNTTEYIRDVFIRHKNIQIKKPKIEEIKSIDNIKIIDNVEITKSIYKIYCKDESIKELYIGQTINLISRTYGHKRNCYDKSLTKQKVHKFIIKNGGWDNWWLG